MGTSIFARHLLQGTSFRLAGSNKSLHRQRKCLLAAPNIQRCSMSVSLRFHSSTPVVMVLSITYKKRNVMEYHVSLPYRRRLTITSCQFYENMKLTVSRFRASSGSPISSQEFSNDETLFFADTSGRERYRWTRIINNFRINRGASEYLEE